MTNDESSKPPTENEPLSNTAELAKAQREREDMLAYVQWSGDGGNNLD